MSPSDMTRAASWSRYAWTVLSYGHADISTINFTSELGNVSVSAAVVEVGFLSALAGHGRYTLPCQPASSRH